MSASFRIQLNHAGKLFSRNRIFGNLSLELNTPDKAAILGPNGSGKSTLLHIVSGQMSPSEGAIAFFLNDAVMEADEVYKHVSIAAPYLELIEEFTMEEIIRFHFKFKKPVKNMNEEDVIRISGLQESGNKALKYFSSGMKQRVKLCLAILSDVNLVLLDEPLTNLDKAGAEWYKNLATEYLAERMAVVCSNHNAGEYGFCNRHIDITEYKKEK